MFTMTIDLLDICILILIGVSIGILIDMYAVRHIICFKKDCNNRIMEDK